MSGAWCKLSVMVATIVVVGVAAYAEETTGLPDIYNPFVPLLTPFPAPTPIIPESAKGPLLQGWAQSLHYERPPPPIPAKPFCEDFLDDLKILRGITFVEPVARATAYDDPALAPYRAQCSGLRLDEHVVVGDVENLTYYASANFAVFQVDIDNDPDTGINGNETVLYAERICRKEDYHSCLGARYSIFDHPECKVDVEEVNDRVDYYAPRTDTFATNAIVIYRNRFYIIDGHFTHNFTVGNITLREHLPRNTDPENRIYSLSCDYEPAAK